MYYRPDYTRNACVKVNALVLICGDKVSNSALAGANLPPIWLPPDVENRESWCVLGINLILQIE